jgi:penicillin G amidase
VRGDELMRAAEWVPMTTHTETINVAGGDPIELNVRTTVHGPLISDVQDLTRVINTPANPTTAIGSYGVSLAWSGLVPGRTSAAIFALNTARSAADVQAAAALQTVPTQTIVFATVDGDIGFQAAGLVPVRGGIRTGAVAADGTWPQNGQNPANDWAGWVPADQMPRALNPERGYIIAANQAVLETGVGPFLGVDWDYGFRARRIEQELLLFTQRHIPITPGDFTAIQLDDFSPIDYLLRPTLLDQDLPNEYSATGQHVLRDWDGYLRRDSGAAAYLMSTWRNLLQDAFWDELPSTVRAQGTSRWALVFRQMLERPHDSFWDDRSTLNIVESRDEVVRNALVAARNEMTVNISKNPVDWEWGKLHTLQLTNPIVGTESHNWFLRHFVNLPKVGLPGSPLSVNAISWDGASDDYSVTTGPTMRMVVDLGNLDNSTWQNLTGVSGHAFSRNYRDQFENWVSGEPYRWLYTPEMVRSATRDTLTLNPA